MNNNSSTKTKLLLPCKFKTAGYVCILPGFILLLIRFYFDIKPSFFDIKTFALYSTYLQTKYFSVIENHFTEEIGGFLIFLGFAFIILSIEKDEKPEFNEIRLKAFFITFYANYLFLIISILFVFGIAFIKVIMIGLLLPSLVYFCLFKYFLWRFRKNLKLKSNED